MDAILKSNPLGFFQVLHLKLALETSLSHRLLQIT